MSVEDEGCNHALLRREGNTEYLHPGRRTCEVDFASICNWRKERGRRTTLRISVSKKKCDRRTELIEEDVMASLSLSFITHLHSQMCV